MNARVPAPLRRSFSSRPAGLSRTAPPPAERAYKRHAPRKKWAPHNPFKVPEKILSFAPVSDADDKRRMRSISGSANLLKRGVDELQKNRPFTIPKGEFRPKQSLGQNFLSDQNYVNKIVDAFSCSSKHGCRVVELGPGPGALTRVLFQRYPLMTGIEVDQRAIMFLREKIPDVNILHQDVLKVDWARMAADLGGPLSIVGNLPYNITSQILFSLIDNYKAVNKAVVTAQYEVGARIVAKPSTKQYGILSVAFQLYSTPVLNFKIPPSVFFPKPKVMSALVTLDFTRPHPDLHRVSIYQLRRLLLTSFQQRRKMLRTSLKDLLDNEGLSLPEEYHTKRPEELSPEDFLRLTVDLFGENVLDGDNLSQRSPIGSASHRRERISQEIGTVVISEDGGIKEFLKFSDENDADGDSASRSPLSRDHYTSQSIWRKAMIPYIINNSNRLHQNILKDAQRKKRKMLAVDMPFAQSLGE